MFEFLFQWFILGMMAFAIILWIGHGCAGLFDSSDLSNKDCDCKDKK